ncbi:MAG: hypothetical protein E7560_06315, partial [Ruminococcaceae bacterium]|nr:hypothetical protein [Oscillospiraceae bacterium]
GSTTRVYQYVKVEKNATYKVSADIISNGIGGLFFDATSVAEASGQVTSQSKNTIYSYMSAIATLNEWVNVGGEVYSGDNEYILVVFTFFGSKDGKVLHVDNVVLEKVASSNTSKNLVLNPGFEGGLSNWKTMGSPAPAATTSTASEGSKSIIINGTAGSTTRVYQYVKVEKNTTYKVSADIISNGIGGLYFDATPVTEANGEVISQSQNHIFSYMSAIATLNEWVNVGGEVYSGENEYILVVFTFYGSKAGKVLYVDNVIVEENEPSSNLIFNSSFEGGLSNWSTMGSPAPAVTESTASDGSKAIVINGIAGSTTRIYQYVKVEKNTTYKVSADIISNGIGGLYFDATPVTEANGEVISQSQNTIYSYMSAIATLNEWVNVGGEVYSGDNEYILVVFTFFGSKDGKVLYVDNVVLEKVASNSDSDFVVNPSFENGLSGWGVKGSPAPVTTTTASEGSKAIVINGIAESVTRVYQYVKVEKNTQYKVNADIISNGIGGLFFDATSVEEANGDVIAQSKNTIYSYMSAIDILNEWVNVGGIVASGDNEYILVVFTLFGAKAGKTIYIDNVTFEKVGTGNSIVYNSEFNDGNRFWSGDEDFFKVDTTADKDGGAALNIKSSFHKVFSQEVKLTEGNYKLDFDYKGTIPEGKIFWGIGKEETTLSTHKAVITQSVPSASDWTHYSVVFNVATAYKSAYFMLQSTIGCDVLIDNIILEPTEEPATIAMEVNRAWVVGPVYENLAEMFLGAPVDGSSMLLNGDLTTTSSEPYNNAMNYIATDNDKDGVSCVKIVSGGTDVSHYSDSAIKLEAGSKEEIISIPLKLEPNKTYCFGFMGKSVDYYAKNGEFTRFTYGIADGSTGNYLTVQNVGSKTDHSWKQYQDYFQFLGINDNKWHWNAYSFKTNDQTDFYLQFRATHATVYLDTLAVWDPVYSSTVVTNSPLSTIEKSVEFITDEPNYLGIKDGGVNLVENFNFEDAVDSYWSDSSKFVNYMYGKSLNIVDTGDSVQGEAFYYEPDVLYPHNIYYFKWIDVEPNTEYTFSAKYAITKVGNGGFGLVNGYNAAGIESTWDSNGNVISENQMYPTIIKEYSFGENNYLEDQSWQTVGFTFNSKDLNRVGIFVKDSGGTAYMDDFRLFKTSDGALLDSVSDDFPKKFEPNKAGISVEDEFAFGFTSGTKLSDVVASFENSQYIKIYDANKKVVTDLNRLAETGMEIRLINGPQIAARAKIVIKGDVNGDGLVDAKDVEAIIKHLSYEKVIENDIYLEAADYNNDGKVNIYDTNFNANAAKEGKSDFVLTGPDKFAVGDEIEISLLASEDNLRALNGKLKYNKSALTFVSAALDVSGNWVLSIDDDTTASEVNFYAADTTKNSGSEKGKEIITFTFKVGEVQKYSDIKLQLAELFSTSGANLLSSAEYLWTPGKVPPTNTDTNTGTNTGTNSGSSTGSQTTPGGPTELVVKAKNRLSELRLDGIKISPEFDPEIKEYTATVPFSVDKVKVIAVAEDENATITIGKTDLEYVGRNSVTVKVVSEDGLQRTYRIIVTREAPEKSANTDNDVSSGLPIWAIVLIAVGGLVVLGGATFVIIVIAKKRKKA